MNEDNIKDTLKKHALELREIYNSVECKEKISILLFGESLDYYFTIDSDSIYVTSAYGLSIDRKKYYLEEKMGFKYKYFDFCDDKKIIEDFLSCYDEIKERLIDRTIRKKTSEKQELFKAVDSILDKYDNKTDDVNTKQKVSKEIIIDFGDRVVEVLDNGSFCLVERKSKEKVIVKTK